MSTDFRIIRDDLDISTNYKQTYFICTHLYFSIKNEMFNIRLKCHPGGSMTSRVVHKQHQRIPRTLHLQRFITWVTCFQSLSKYLSLHFVMSFYALLDSNVALTVLRFQKSKIQPVKNIHFRAQFSGVCIYICQSTPRMCH